jgi:hypothetical protein
MEEFVMWQPKTENDIIYAVQSGSLEESAIFDAKEELPSKNQEIAKDIAAMANDGGVIIYGIGEDEHGRVTKLTPIPLAGQAEKIDAVVRSSIAESPVIHISSVQTKENPEVGYLIVHIPPSERAPHMVVVKGDHRFYGRTATGNYPLPEGEVARLYARRQQSEVDREKLLDAEINTSPLAPNEDYAYLYLFARPVFAREGFFDSLVSNGKNFQTVLNALVSQVSEGTVYKRNFAPDFKPPPFWRLTADGFLGELKSSNREDIIDPRSTLNLQVDFTGLIHLFCGRVASKEQKDMLMFFPEIIAGLTIRFSTFVAGLYQKTKYVGMVDMGIAITGIKGSVVFTDDWILQHNTGHARKLIS